MTLSATRSLARSGLACSPIKAISDGIVTGPSYYEGGASSSSSSIVPSSAGLGLVKPQSDPKGGNDKASAKEAQKANLLAPWKKKQ